MANTTVSSGVTSAGLTETAGNGVDVLNGGRVSDITVSSGSIVTNSSGVSATTPSAGLVVEAGGVDTGATILAGGTEVVLGSASGDQVFGLVYVSGGTAVVTSETVQNGGTLELALAGTVASGAIVNAGGILSINARGNAINTTLNGGTVELLTAKSTLSGTLTFTAPSTLLISAVTSAPSSSAYGDQAVISGFTTGDVIDDRVLAGGTLTTTMSGGNTIATLTSTGTGGTPTILETFIFAGAEQLRAMTDGVGGTEIVACYCEGTRILTDAGEVAVEALAVGDNVITVDGGIEPICWIGRRTYRGRHLTGRRHLLPVRIKAGALDEASPKRDLLVSPLHAMLINGILVPAYALINGKTVIQETAAETVCYVHIELAQHNAVWAEGAASETFVDDNGRFIFQSSKGVAVSEPDKATYCAPRVDQGYALEAVRRRLAKRVLLLA